MIIKKLFRGRSYTAGQLLLIGNFFDTGCNTDPDPNAVGIRQTEVSLTFLSWNAF